MRLSLILTVTALAISGGWAFAKRAVVYDEFLFKTSSLLHGLRTSPLTDPLVLKSAFAEIPTPNVSAVRNHTHGLSAANRSSGSFFIDLLSKTIARPAWFYQRSGADVRNGRAGSRTFFWVKDLATAPERNAPPDDAVLAMIDVDQYVDMPTFLVDNFKPVLIYTFQPSSVSRSKGEYAFTFNGRDEVDYRVSGGGHYAGRVWNYDGDSLKCVKRLFGIAYAMTTYHVERRHFDRDHQVILLAPSASFRGLGATLADWLLDGRELARLRVNHNGFLRLRAMTSEGLMVSTGIVGRHLSADVSADVDDAIASVSRTSKSGLTLPMVKTRMGDDWAGSEILHEFHKSGLIANMDSVSVVKEHVRSYQYMDENELDEFAKPSMVPFMAPIIDGAFVPESCKNNDVRAVSKRIWEQVNTTHLTPHVVKVIDEFIDFILGPLKGTLHPVDEDYLKEKQSRPTQRRILEEAEFTSATDVTSTFMKKEAYPTVGDPRIISTINGVDKRDYSLFIYALTDVIKTKEWYAFSKTPREVSERVAQICSRAKKMAVNTDFSRMDGRVSEILRFFEQRLLVCAFDAYYSDEIVRIVSKMVGLKGITKYGLTYSTLLARLSGAPETSTMNTCDNALVAYMTFRSMKKPDGTYYTPIEAYDCLGLYGGDDGITADVDIRKYVKCAWKVGQKLELDPIARGSFGITFLARMYGPDVWHGDTNSCCSIYRALSKFHVTVHLPSNITPMNKLQDKAFALWLTDRNTPVVGDFVSKAATNRTGFTNICGAWNVADVDDQYPNESSDWMQDYVNSQLPNFDQDNFINWLDEAELTDLLECPTFTTRPEITMKPGRAVVDGDIFDHKPPLETKQPSRSEPAVSTEKIRSATFKSRRALHLKK